MKPNTQPSVVIFLAQLKIKLLFCQAFSQGMVVSTTFVPCNLSKPYFFTYFASCLFRKRFCFVFKFFTLCLPVWKPSTHDNYTICLNVASYKNRAMANAHSNWRHRVFSIGAIHLWTNKVVALNGCRGL